jgi:cob(I)alamin adenosyltransferase
MFGDEQAAAAADAQQAEYFRRYLQDQRSELTEELAQQIRDLNRYVTMGASPNVSHVQKAIRRVEVQIRSIDRMVAAIPRTNCYALSLDSFLFALRSTNSGMSSRMGRPSNRAYSSCTSVAT